MKIIIKDVGYKRGYVTGPYLQESAGANADIVLEEGEDQEEAAIKALNYLKGITDKFHAQAHPGEDKTGGGSHTIIPQQGPEVIDYKKWERFEIDIDNAETSDELELIIKQVDTFPGRLLSTINAKRQALKPKNFVDGLE